MKRALSGFLWAVIFYFGACALVGGVVGAQWGAKHPGNVNQAAVGRAVEQELRPLIPYFLGGALTLGVLGAATGVLPGSRRA